MRWGTEVPLLGYEEKVIYSWFDACIGYVSITAQYTDQWEEWWRNPDVQLHQFIGKDNVVYHPVIFPGSQIGTGEKWTKLHHLSTIDYLTYGGGKFPKSHGIGVFGDLPQKIGVPSDVWRYFLLSHRPETGDTEFTWDSFISCNNLLLKDFGSFVNRVLKFTNSQHCNNVVPNWTEYHEASLDAWKEEVNELPVWYIRELDAVKPRAALSIVLQLSQHGNLFLQSNKLDNNLAVYEPSKCAVVLGLAINLIHLLASIIAPYMPETATAINAQLRMDPLPIPNLWKADSVNPGHIIGKAEYWFSRIKPEKAEEWRKQFSSEEAKKVKDEEAKMKSKKSAAMKAAKMTEELNT